MVAEEVRRKAAGLVNTSVDDCRTSLFFEADRDVVREALRIAEDFGHKTRAGMLRAKIKREGW